MDCSGIKNVLGEEVRQYFQGLPSPRNSNIHSTNENNVINRSEEVNQNTMNTSGVYYNDPQQYQRVNTIVDQPVVWSGLSAGPGGGGSATINQSSNYSFSEDNFQKQFNNRSYNTQLTYQQEIRKNHYVIKDSHKYVNSIMKTPYARQSDPMKHHQVVYQENYPNKTVVTPSSSSLSSNRIINEHAHFNHLNNDPNKVILDNDPNRRMNQSNNQQISELNRGVVNQPYNINKNVNQMNGLNQQDDNRINNQSDLSRSGQQSMNYLNCVINDQRSHKINVPTITQNRNSYEMNDKTMNQMISHQLRDEHDPNRIGSNNRIINNSSNQQNFYQNNHPHQYHQIRNDPNLSRYQQIHSTQRANELNNQQRANELNNQQRANELNQQQRANELNQRSIEFNQQQRINELNQHRMNELNQQKLNSFNQQQQQQQQQRINDVNQQRTNEFNIQRTNNDINQQRTNQMMSQMQSLRNNNNDLRAYEMQSRNNLNQHRNNELVQTKNNELAQIQARNNDLVQMQGKNNELAQMQTKNNELVQMQIRNNELVQMQARTNELAQIQARNNELAQMQVKNNELAQIQARNNELVQMQIRNNEVVQTRNEKSQARASELFNIQARNNNMNQATRVNELIQSRTNQIKTNELVQSRNNAITKTDLVHTQARNIDMMMMSSRKNEMQQYYTKCNNNNQYNQQYNEPHLNNGYPTTTRVTQNRVQQKSHYPGQINEFQTKITNQFNQSSNQLPSTYETSRQTFGTTSELAPIGVQASSRQENNRVQSELVRPHQSHNELARPSSHNELMRPPSHNELMRPMSHNEIRPPSQNELMRPPSSNRPPSQNVNRQFSQNELSIRSPFQNELLISRPSSQNDFIRSPSQNITNRPLSSSQNELINRSPSQNDLIRSPSQNTRPSSQNELMRPLSQNALNRPPSQNELNRFQNELSSSSSSQNRSPSELIRTTQNELNRSLNELQQCPSSNNEPVTKSLDTIQTDLSQQSSAKCETIRPSSNSGTIKILSENELVHSSFENELKSSQRDCSSNNLKSILNDVTKFDEYSSLNGNSSRSNGDDVNMNEQLTNSTVHTLNQIESKRDEIKLENADQSSTSNLVELKHLETLKIEKDDKMVVDEKLNDGGGGTNKSNELDVSSRTINQIKNETIKIEIDEKHCENNLELKSEVIIDSKQIKLENNKDEDNNNKLIKDNLLNIKFKQEDNNNRLLSKDNLLNIKFKQENRLLSSSKDNLDDRFAKDLNIKNFKQENDNLDKATMKQETDEELIKKHATMTSTQPSSVTTTNYTNDRYMESKINLKRSLEEIKNNLNFIYDSAIKNKEHIKNETTTTTTTYEVKNPFQDDDYKVSGGGPYVYKQKFKLPSHDISLSFNCANNEQHFANNYQINKNYNNTNNFNYHHNIVSNDDNKNLNNCQNISNNCQNLKIFNSTIENNYQKDNKHNKPQQQYFLPKKDMFYVPTNKQTNQLTQQTKQNYYNSTNNQLMPPTQQQQQQNKESSYYMPINNQLLSTQQNNKDTFYGNKQIKENFYVPTNKQQSKDNFYATNNTNQQQCKESFYVPNQKNNLYDVSTNQFNSQKDSFYASQTKQTFYAPNNKLLQTKENYFVPTTNLQQTKESFYVPMTNNNNNKQQTKDSFYVPTNKLQTKDSSYFVPTNLQQTKDSYYAATQLNKQTKEKQNFYVTNQMKESSYNNNTRVPPTTTTKDTTTYFMQKGIKDEFYQKTDTTTYYNKSNKMQTKEYLQNQLLAANYLKPPPTKIKEEYPPAKLPVKDNYNNTLIKNSYAPVNYNMPVKDNMNYLQIKDNNYAPVKDNNYAMTPNDNNYATNNDKFATSKTNYVGTTVKDNFVKIKDEKYFKEYDGPSIRTNWDKDIPRSSSQQLASHEYNVQYLKNQQQTVKQSTSSSSIQQSANINAAQITNNGQLKSKSSLYTGPSAKEHSTVIKQVIKDNNTVVKKSPSSITTKVKRESPLDLSCKTIRQIADSTEDTSKLHFRSVSKIQVPPISVQQYPIETKKNPLYDKQQYYGEHGNHNRQQQQLLEKKHNNDRWRQFFDQQIEQRISNYKEEQAKHKTTSATTTLQQQQQQQETKSKCNNSGSYQDIYLKKLQDHPKVESEDDQKPNSAIITTSFGDFKNDNSSMKFSINADLDGLAANLAARIRTKAELKQLDSSDKKKMVEKVVEEVKIKIEYSIDEQKKDMTRSCSETSVFDFHESDGEMGDKKIEKLVRKKSVASAAGVVVQQGQATKANNLENIINSELEQGVVKETEIFFDNTCDKFLEQLRSGGNKQRRGRKPKQLTHLAQFLIDNQEYITPKTEQRFSDDDENEPIILGIQNRKVKALKSEKKRNQICESDSDTDNEPPVKRKKLIGAKLNLISDESDGDDENQLNIPKVKPCTIVLDKLNEKFLKEIYGKDPLDTTVGGATSSGDEFIPKKPIRKQRNKSIVTQSIRSNLRSSRKLRENRRRICLIKQKKRKQRSKVQIAEKDPLDISDFKKLADNVDDDVKEKRGFYKKQSTVDDMKKLIGNKKTTIENDRRKSLEISSEFKLKRMFRRKLSSGFDYIRKKKKSVTKLMMERRCRDSSNETKKRCSVTNDRASSIDDIQKEIKFWVLNKGIGETHLHRAARLGYTDVVAYCLEVLGNGPSPKDNAGYTPLHEACARGHLHIAKLLLLYGANVHESAQGGIRPLHEAVENNFVEIVRLLLSYGADPLLATYSGLTPLSIANEDEMTKMLEYYLDDVRGKTDKAPPWYFNGPSFIFENNEESGCDTLAYAPDFEKTDELLDDDIEIEECIDQALPNLYKLVMYNTTTTTTNEYYVLLQDLISALKLKSKEALLRQLLGNNNNNNNNNLTTQKSNLIKELKMAEFLEQAHCTHILSGGERINLRASKISLVKYTDKVKELLAVKKYLVSNHER